MLLAVVIELDPRDAPAFDAYEERVLALLARHGGELQRRLRSGDRGSEIHILSFADDAALRAYLDDPERAAARTLLGGVEISSRVLRVDDVEV